MKPFSEERIRAYFLGRFPAPEAEVFEEECAASAEATELAQTVERELADDYLRGSLSAADARLFEENYLVTETRRRRLQAAKNLWQTAGRERREKAAAAGRSSFWQKYFGGRMAFQFAGGLLLLLVCAALAFYLAGSKPAASETAELKVAEPAAETERRIVPTAEVEKQNPKSEAANSAAPSDREDDEDAEIPPKNEPAPKPAATRKANGPNSVSPAVFTLYAGTLRSDGEQFINLLPATRDIRLQLKLPAESGKYKTYRAAVKPVEGEAVYNSPDLKSPSLTIPAEKLENRTYIVFLEGKNAANEFESIAEYSFRVRR